MKVKGIKLKDVPNIGGKFTICYEIEIGKEKRTFDSKEKCFGWILEKGTKKNQEGKDIKVKIQRLYKVEGLADYIKPGKEKKEWESS